MHNLSLNKSSRPTTINNKNENNNNN